MKPSETFHGYLYLSTRARERAEHQYVPVFELTIGHLNLISRLLPLVLLPIPILRFIARRIFHQQVSQRASKGPLSAVPCFSPFVSMLCCMSYLCSAHYPVYTFFALVYC